jgi:nitrile hydratase
MHDDHPHPHDHRPDQDGPLSDYQLMEIAVRELLIEKRILTADEIRGAVEAMIEMGGTKLVVVESTPEIHNLIVCTLCSCYPRMLLGLPPDWYKSRAYRARAVREPREVLREFGTVLPDDVTVRVHDSTADMRYLVLPLRPAGTAGWSEERLAGLVTRDSMVGVSLPKAA